MIGGQCLRWLKTYGGKLFGDKGYISAPLSALLMGFDLRLVTKIKKKMKNRLLSVCDKLLMRKRSLIETVNDQLKNISQVEDTRHRSLWNFLGNVAAGLIAYTFREKKPSLNLHKYSDRNKLKYLLYGQIYQS